MRALVITGPRAAEVQVVPAPVAGAGELVVDVERAGICGTDIELYTGEMAYFAQGFTRFPLRIGHEWAGRVTAVGSAEDEHWIGTRVTGDTMLGCGRCAYCRSGRHHVCPDRFEIGIRGGWPGALAEQVRVPTRFAHAIPESVGETAAALVEPGGNALRAVRAAEAAPGRSVLVLGSGTIGLLAAQFALAEGAEVHVGGVHEETLALARRLGAHRTWSSDELAAGPRHRFDAVIDATTDASVPALGVELVKPTGRVVCIGISATPSLVDTRSLVFDDVTVVGILSASPGLPGAIAGYASRAVVPDAIVGEVVALDDVPDRLEGRRGASAGPGPKVHVDPRL